MFLLRMVFMTQGKWSRLSPTQRADIWKRWKAGQTLHEIGRTYGKPHPTIRKVLLPRGGIPPVARRRSWLALTLAEREDILRGIASGWSFCERGSNENTNLLLWQYFPRGTDLSPFSQAQLDQVSLRLKQRPRKTLGFETPASKLQASVASTV